MNETVNFVEKTKFGDEITSKDWWMKKKEQRLKDISAKRMPSVADLLKQAAEAPKAGGKSSASQAS